MGWLFSIILFIFGCIKGVESMLIASGLFAIAGSIGTGASALIGAMKNINVNWRETHERTDRTNI